MSREFGGINRSEMGEIETQAIGRDQRAGLLHVRAENIAQRGVHQVRAGVVALDVRAACGIGDGGDAIANVQGFLRDDAMRDRARRPDSTRRGLRRLRARFGVVVKCAGVGDLSAGFGIDGGAIENDFGFFARADFVDRAVFGDDGFDAAVFARGAKVKIGLGFESFGELGEDWIGGILVRAFPGCASARALLLPSRDRNLPNRTSMPASRATSSMKSRGRPKVS